MAEETETDGKKQKVIHTRVSEGLEQALKEKAAQLGMSMSTLVRNVLGATVELVGEAVLDGVRPGKAARGVGRHGAAATAAGPVLGYQEFTLAINALCEACNGILVRGGSAWIAVGGAPSVAVYCESCAHEACGGATDGAP
jgi:hypothetical protein